MNDIKKTGAVESDSGVNGPANDFKGIGLRIRQVRFRHELSQKKFADLLRISRKWLSELENGKKCPSGLLLLGMECRFAISRDWILDAKGSMFVSLERDVSSTEAVLFFRDFNKLSRQSRENLLEIMSAFLFIEDNEEYPSMVDF